MGNALYFRHLVLEINYDVIIVICNADCYLESCFKTGAHIFTQLGNHKIRTFKNSTSIQIILLTLSVA